MEKNQTQTVKTNATRLLETAGIPFKTVEYPVDETDLSGEHAAEMLGMDPERLFKTLVLKGEKVGYFVCCLPANAELDLKKAAHVAGDKKVAMIPMKDLKEVTGYIRGGCSPLGMKKSFPTYLDENSILYDEIAVSAGRRGAMILLNPDDLAAYLHLDRFDLTKRD